MKLVAAISRVIGRVVHGSESLIRQVRWTRNGGFPRPDISLIAGLVVPLLLWSAGVGIAQIVDTTLWSPNGPVFSIVPDRSTIYIGGSFTSVGGQPRNNTASFDAATGTLTAWDPYVTQGSPPPAVTAIAVSGGTTYVGGNFNAVGVPWQFRNNIAALDAATGAVTAWNPTAISRIFAPACRKRSSIITARSCAPSRAGAAGTPRNSAITRKWRPKRRRKF